MKNRTKLLMRTRTFERIVIRQKEQCSGNSPGASSDALPDGKYRFEIYKIDDDGRQIVFACEFIGSVDFVGADKDFLSGL